MTIKTNHLDSSKKALIIIGAGNFGNEIETWMQHDMLTDNQLYFAGYLDDDQTISDFGSIGDFFPKENQRFICAISAPKTREKIVQILLKKGCKFTNIIHNTACICSKIQPDSGLVLAPFTYISANATIKPFVLINSFASIGHDVLIGEFSTISSHCDLTGFVQLDERIFMGSHANIIPKKHIGADAVIAAGSSVMRNVPPSSTVIGVPAKKIF